MRYKFDFPVETVNRLRKMFTAALLLGCALGTTPHAAAQHIAAPTTPAAITAPLGTSVFLVGHATGTQGYVCLPQTSGASWTANAARPEAALFTDFFGQPVQIITHFLSPVTSPNENAPSVLAFGNATWQSSFDSSKVWAQASGSITAGSDPSCPNDGAIPCLLLQAIGSDKGPGGGKLLTKTTYIQRLHTKGGAAPADGCAIPADVGKQALVSYTADYYFYRGNQ